MGLLGCTSNDTAAEPAPARENTTQEEKENQEAWRQELVKRIDEQLEADAFSFTLTLDDGISFEGHESTGNWTLVSQDKESDEAIRIKQEDGTIRLTRGDQTETLTTRQFGLVAPRDHLKLVRESVLRVRKESNNEQIRYEVDLNKEQIGDKLGRWMGEGYEAGAANQASRKFHFRYVFQFDETGLREMEMKIIPLQEDDSIETIRYTFKSP
jgi:transcriptional antiterminator Rof (Rho-off)